MNYRLTENSITLPDGRKLYQIQCIRDFQYAKSGELGGFIESTKNLSGNAWVYGNARVYGNAYVYGYSRVYGNACVFGNAKLEGNAMINNNNSHCGFDLFGSENRHTHAYLTSDGSIEITCGCFRGNLKDFEEKVKLTHHGTIYEKQYMAIADLIRLKLDYNYN